MIAKRQARRLPDGEGDGYRPVARAPALLRSVLAGCRARIAQTLRGATLGGGDGRFAFPSQGYMDGRPFLVFGVTQPTVVWLDVPGRCLNGSAGRIARDAKRQSTRSSG